MKQLLTIILFCQLSLCVAQTPVVTSDLQSKWQFFNGTSYQSFQKGVHCKTIYIPFNARTGQSDFLQIKSTYPFSVFINQKYLTESNGSLRLSVDSLRQVGGMQSFMLAIHSKKISPLTLSTQLIHYPASPVLEIQAPRPSTSLRDFILIASIVVLCLLVVIMRLNPKLASDYFSVTKIFSLRESEESQVYTRITSSGNFLFYGFSSLTIGFYLVLLLSHLPQPITALPIHSFSGMIKEWGLISLIITLVLGAKMLITYLFASLFKLREVAGLQFFNWVRLLFLMVGFSVALVVVTIVARINSPAWFQFLYSFTGWILAIWLVLVFFKIAAKARIGLFHLFSYLCATEIIPSLIILKILYY